ncbi:hypothetical protein JL722_4799 [Aureococcus anophagefferens]|nr:hypothetical protein JL722_4799 [Aureococcus anophagefferens]
MGRLASVGRCVAVVVYGLAVIAATAYAWDYVVDRSRFADYLQGARDIAYDERRGRLVVSALHADSVAVLDARGEDIALSGLYVDHERFGNAHGFAYDADRELVFAASYTKHSLRARRRRAAAAPSSARLVSNDKAAALEVVDVADPARPVKVGEVYDARIDYVSQLAFDAEANVLYAASQKADSFAVVNVTDPKNPALLAVLVDHEVLDGATGVALDGGEAVAYDAPRALAFVASRTSAAVVAVDVSDPRPSVDRSLCKRPKAFPAYVALALAAAVAAAHLALICGLRSLRARRDAEKNAYVMVDTFDELGDDDDDDGIELGAVDAEPEDTTPPEKEPETAADAPPPPPEASPEPPLAKRD